jgi:hypothetical protein
MPGQRLYRSNTNASLTLNRVRLQSRGRLIDGSGMSAPASDRRLFRSLKSKNDMQLARWSAAMRYDAIGTSLGSRRQIKSVAIGGTADVLRADCAPRSALDRSAAISRCSKFPPRDITISRCRFLVLRKLFPDTRPEIPSPAGSPV